LLLAFAMPPLAGCAVVESRMMSLSYFSATSAAYAGRFRLAHGRWPGDARELGEFVCTSDHVELSGFERGSCDDVLGLPYRLELTRDGDDLRIRYFESDAAVCSLRLLAPPAHTDSRVFSMIVIKSTLFACHGGLFVQRKLAKS
jgi:hypothetical protein